MLENGRVHDKQRQKYFKDHLQQVLNAQKSGVKITGYFIWTFIDNLEWAEGYHPRFGIVYNNFETQERTIKDSGYWFQNMLND